MQLKKFTLLESWFLKFLVKTQKETFIIGAVLNTLQLASNQLMNFKIKLVGCNFKEFENVYDYIQTKTQTR